MLWRPGYLILGCQSRNRDEARSASFNVWFPGQSASALWGYRGSMRFINAAACSRDALKFKQSVWTPPCWCRRVLPLVARRRALDAAPLWCEVQLSNHVYYWLLLEIVFNIYCNMSHPTSCDKGGKQSCNILLLELIWLTTLNHGQRESLAKAFFRLLEDQTAHTL